MTAKSSKNAATLILAILVAGCATFKAPTFELTSKSIETGAVPYWRGELARIQSHRRAERQWAYLEVWNSLDKDGLSGFDSALVRIKGLDMKMNPFFYREQQAIQVAANDAYMIWLKQKILDGSGDPRFSYIYANWLWRAKSNDPSLGYVAGIMHETCASSSRD